MVSTVDEFDAAILRARHVEAEQGVIGGCMMRPQVLGWLELEAREFFDPRHHAIWEAMRSLHSTGGAVDEVTVLSKLREMGKDEAVGGLAYLSQLGLRVPNEDSTEHYAAIVHEHFVNRSILYLAASVPSRFNEEISGEELLADVQRGLSDIDVRRRADAVDVSEAVAEELGSIREFLRAQQAGEPVSVGVPTGIEPIDRRIGGIIMGAPTVLGGRPASGKSSFALSIANHSAQSGFPVHLFTYEDRRTTFAQRELSFYSGVPVDRIRSRQFERGDLELLGRAKDEFMRPRGIEVEHAHGMPISTLVRRVRGRRRELKTQLVILDYIQLCPATDRRMKRYEAIGANMQQLVELAGRDDLAVLVLSQLGRDNDKEKRRPVMSDLRESGDLEQHAKLILALHSTNRDAPTIEVLVLKNHQGPEAIIDVYYDRARCRIGGQA